MKYTRVRSLSSRLGIEDNRRLLNDFGSEFTVDLSWTLMEDLTWRTRLYGYTTYERVELEWGKHVRLPVQPLRLSADLPLSPLRRWRGAR